MFNSLKEHVLEIYHKFRLAGQESLTIITCNNNSTEPNLKTKRDNSFQKRNIPYNFTEWVQIHVHAPSIMCIPCVVRCIHLVCFNRLQFNPMFTWPSIFTTKQIITNLASHFIWKHPKKHIQSQKDAPKNPQNTLLWSRQSFWASVSKSAGLRHRIWGWGIPGAFAKGLV